MDLRMNTQEESMNLSPVFIIGAGRSGTTLFYKLLCLHSDVAWISNYMQRMPRWVFLSCLNKIFYSKKLRCASWFSNNSNAYIQRKKIIKKLFPMPDEGEGVYNACGIPVFPNSSWQITEVQKKSLARQFEKIRFFQIAKVFLSKRTANNRRIPQLIEAFPDSKFIHVIRDGRSVCRSLLNVDWWEDHQIYWKDLKSPRQLKKDGANPVHLAARNWVEEINSITEGLKSVPSDQLLEVRYEDFHTKINDILLRVVDFIGLNHDPLWWDVVGSIQIVNKNVYRDAYFQADDKAAVMKIQMDTLKQLGYLE